VHLINKRKLHSTASGFVGRSPLYVRKSHSLEHLQQLPWEWQHQLWGWSVLSVNMSQNWYNLTLKV